MLSKDPDVTQTETSGEQRVLNFKFLAIYVSYPTLPFVSRKRSLSSKGRCRRFLAISGNSLSSAKLLMGVVVSERAADQIVLMTWG